MMAVVLSAKVLVLANEWSARVFLPAPQKMESHYAVTHYRSVLAPEITTAEQLVLELSDGRPWPCCGGQPSRPAEADPL